MRIAADIALAIYRSGVFMSMDEACEVLNAIAPHYRDGTRTPEALAAACRALFSGFDDYAAETKAHLEEEATHVLAAAEAANSTQIRRLSHLFRSSDGQKGYWFLRDAYGLDLAQVEALGLREYAVVNRLACRLVVAAAEGRLDRQTHDYLTDLAEDIEPLFCTGCGADLSHLPGANTCASQCADEAQAAYC